MSDSTMMPPRDRFKVVYLIMLLHGIGVLLPWNMFITAKSYFVDYKLSANYTGQQSEYSTNFMAYLGFASQIPNVIFNWVNIFIQFGGDLTSRIFWSITVEVIIFIITIILAMVDSHAWPGAFFWITMICVVILNMANGVYQNTIFGVVAKLPPKFTGVAILGSNISGTFASVISIFSMLSTSNYRIAAIYYFITALFVLLLCFDTYFSLPLNNYYRYYEEKNKRESLHEGFENKKEISKIPYRYIFKKCFPQLLNVILIFFVTLSVFPEINSNIKHSDKDFFIDETFYTSITCFLTFNVCAMAGSSLTSFFIWPKPKYVWIAVCLRVVYIPLFLFCNYHPIGVHRELPVYINNDWAYWFIAITMGLSSGYLSSVSMIYVPQSVEPIYAATAGMFGAASLITGIFSGILFSLIWPQLVGSVIST